MKIFNKQNNKDIGKRIDYLDQKLDLIHKSVARLRIDLPCLIHNNKAIEKMEELN
jgi:hypothetical protein